MRHCLQQVEYTQWDLADFCKTQNLSVQIQLSLLQRSLTDATQQLEGSALVCLPHSISTAATVYAGCSQPIHLLEFDQASTPAWDAAQLQ